MEIVHWRGFVFRSGPAQKCASLSRRSQSLHLGGLCALWSCHEVIPSRSKRPTRASKLRACLICLPWASPRCRASRGAQRGFGGQGGGGTHTRAPHVGTSSWFCRSLPLLVFSLLSPLVASESGPSVPELSSEATAGIASGHVRERVHGWFRALTVRDRPFVLRVPFQSQELWCRWGCRPSPWPECLTKFD